MAGSQVHMNSIGASSTWGPGWLKPDAVGIKVTDGLIDIDSKSPTRPPKSTGTDKFGNDIMERGRQPNKIFSKTTVSDFVTHEPYDRQSSNRRKQKLIDEMISEIKNDNPLLSSDQLADIQKELLKQPSIKAVSEKLGKVVKLNKDVNLNASKLIDLTNKATNLDSLIKSNVQSKVINFVQGQVASAVSAVRSFFRF